MTLISVLSFSHLLFFCDKFYFYCLNLNSIYMIKQGFVLEGRSPSKLTPPSQRTEREQEGEV